MPGEDNKAMVRRLFEEGINEGDEAAVEEVLSADYVNHDMPAPAKGIEGFQQVIGMFRSGFPDMRVTLEDVFADGDRVGTRGRFTGTHQGDFMGIPATGKPIDVKYIDLWLVRHGKLTENWVQMDMVGLMQQIEAMPGAEGTGGS
ncbi:MAG: ester cyclase [Actinomycetota bacterium]|nr:ester cyclase [Actinomycetota bacterium]